MLIVTFAIPEADPSTIRAFPCRKKRRSATLGIQLEGVVGVGASKGEAVADLARQLVLMGAIEYREAKPRTARRKKVAVEATEEVKVQDSLEITQVPAESIN